ncbi:MAG: hypothetical protein Q9218_001753 [Villophora microphyllina]
MSLGGLAKTKSCATPIKTAIFQHDLLKIWHTNGVFPRPAIFALAVSGGSDSMALATLCAQIEQSRDQAPALRQATFHAFIVDHVARPGSTEEAKQVEAWLHQYLGLSLPTCFCVDVCSFEKQGFTRTRILTLKWPHGTDPCLLPNFETEARRLRYRALGQACFEAQTPSLLLGHHEADETETLIMRLVEGYRGEGLRGIPTEADIANCQGIEGVHQSGGRYYTASRDQVTQPSVLSPVGEYCKPGFEYGGVKIYRPLMGYTKAALQATLEANGIPWVNDATNKDPTLSIRNAVRYLINRKVLPKALHSGQQPDSSNLKMVAGNIKTKYLQRNDQADELFQACEVILLNAKSGYLDVRIPLFPTVDLQKSDCSEDILQDRSFERAQAIRDGFLMDPSKYEWTIENKYIAARLVRHLLNIVTPRDHISLQSLEQATKAMFFSVKSPHSPHSGQSHSKVHDAFTVGDVLCRRIHAPQSRPASSSAESFRLDPEHIWRLSRQPYQSNIPEPECVVPKTDLSSATVHETTDGDVSQPELRWQLWDGRYWIKVLNSGSHDLGIRPLSQDRLVRLKARLKKLYHFRLLNHLQKTLQLHAPGTSRYTLPAVVDEKDEVLALPTLTMTFPDLKQDSRDHGEEKQKSSGSHWWPQTLSFWARYKRVMLPDSIKKGAVIALSEGKERPSGIASINAPDGQVLFGKTSHIKPGASTAPNTPA